MKKVFIVSALRTPVGKFGGSLSSFNAGEIGSIVIKEIISKSGINPQDLDSVIVGNVLSAGQAQGVARQCSIKAGIPDSVPAYGVNMVCGSGMKSVMNAFLEIAHTNASLIIAGGTESMSGSGWILPSTVRNGVKMGNINMLDHMVFDGLTDAYSGVHMGITAENIAEKYSVTREEQDKFSYNSQIKAISAINSGNFSDEIVKIEIVNKKETIIFDKDEYPNLSTSLEKLAALRPAFKKDGSVTAGNSSGVNDGASFVLLADEEALKKYSLIPIAEIIAIGQGGVDPQIMGMGPVPAIKQALENANLQLNQIDLIELNEAFAAQSLGVIKQLANNHGVRQDWIEQRANLNGGAIAIGHPIGASGNRIIVTLVHLMKKREANLGLASLCIGGGMGTAIILKRV